MHTNRHEFRNQLEQMRRYIPSALQRFNYLTIYAKLRHRPRGVVTSVPGGGLNSKVDEGIGVRVWLE